jgi:hypothetical protein
LVPPDKTAKRAVRSSRNVCAKACNRKEVYIVVH